MPSAGSNALPQCHSWCPFAMQDVKWTSQTVMSPDTQWLMAHPFILFFLVALASESGGRGATHLKPRLPHDVPQGQLVGDFLHGLGVTVHRSLHGFQDFLESGLSCGSDWVSLPGVFGKIEEQRWVMVGDELPVAETHVGEKAAVGALGGEVGREEEGFPDGRAVGRVPAHGVQVDVAVMEEELVLGASALP